MRHVRAVLFLAVDDEIYFFLLPRCLRAAGRSVWPLEFCASDKATIKATIELLTTPTQPNPQVHGISSQYIKMERYFFAAFINKSNTLSPFLRSKSYSCAICASCFLFCLLFRPAGLVKTISEVGVNFF